jgi:hypothetical protein
MWRLCPLPRLLFHKWERVARRAGRGNGVKKSADGLAYTFKVKTL